MPTNPINYRPPPTSDEWTLAQTVALYIAVFCLTALALIFLLLLAGFFLKSIHAI